jgi:hypothetical protein
MSTTLTKTGVIFGVALFYVCLIFFLGIMDYGYATGQSEMSFDFGSGIVFGNTYNETHNIYYGVSLWECNEFYNLTGLFDDNPYYKLGYDNPYDNSDDTVGVCIIPNDSVNEFSLWNFQRVTLNVKELKWINILLLFPLIGLVVFILATSSVAYNVE